MSDSISPISSVVWADPAREHAFQTWLTPLAVQHGLELSTLRPASADASFRRYLRLDRSAGGSLIVMDAPPDKENCTPFVQVQGLMQQSGLNVPAILDWNQPDGFMLLSDMGSRTLIEELDPARPQDAELWYRHAVDLLLQWQQASRPDVLPAYDEALLRRELQLFPDWYIAHHRQVTLDDKQQAVLAKAFDQIVAHNLQAPSVYVHRDFMARNLMLPSDPTQALAVLDFQDLVRGPIAYDPVDFQPAVVAAEPPTPVEIVETPVPLPLPGQLQPAPSARRETGSPTASVEAANRAATQEPSRAGYVNAVQVYPWTEGALYRLYAAPERVSDIALQPGEELIAVSAGDTVRWVIGDTVSGAGDRRRVHVLVKPFAAGLHTNMVITTTRRAYHLALESTDATAMAAISWTYPQDQLIALQGRNAVAAAASPAATGVDVSALNFRYRIEGDRVPWTPARAFDDGRQVFIEFPAGISQGEMPPLFVTGASGDAELVNYRVQGRYMVVDRLFAAAELRLGDRRTEQRVRIVRDDGRRGRP